MLPPLTLRALDTAPAPEPETPETPETGLVASSSSVERRSISCSFFFSPDRVRQLAAQHSFAFLLLTYLVLPPCSMVSERSERQCDQRVFILF